jgi:hypothetical protein
MGIKKEPPIGVLPADLVNLAPYPVVIFNIKWPRGRIGESASFYAIGIDKPPAIFRYHYIWRESCQIEDLLGHRPGDQSGLAVSQCDELTASRRGILISLGYSRRGLFSTM